jgi:hypothetical protein
MAEDYSSLIAAIPALIQTGAGAAQTIKGNRMGRGLTDPTMPIPKSAQDALALARLRAGQSVLPGEEQYLNDIAQVMAGAQYGINQGATSSGQALGSTLNAFGQQMKALQDLQRMRAQNINQNQRDLQGALGTMAGYEQNKWTNDVLNPFLRKSQAAQSMVGAGLQNTNAGLSDIAGIFATREAEKEKRAYEEKRENEKWDRINKYFDSTKTAGMVPATSTTGASTSEMTPEARMKMEELDALFNIYGDAYSSGEGVEIREPSTKRDFYGGVY